MAGRFHEYYVGSNRKRNMSSKQTFLLLSTIVLVMSSLAQAQITPAGITLGPSQQAQFSVPGYSQIAWSLVPAAMGKITQAGLYTAPAAYSSSYVYVYAQAGSVYYQTQVHLSPTPVNVAGSTAASVSISVSPASIYLYGGQSQQFTASVGGTSNQQVIWSIIQGVGSISNGRYTAPSAVSSDSLVTISATSTVDPTKTASATIMLGPAASPGSTTPAATTVSVSLKPKNPTLGAGQSKQFTASVSGTSNTAVTWSLNPNVGSVVNGFYTAPTTISTAQSITITATSAADGTTSASANINLAVSSVAAAPAPPPPPSPSVSPAAVSLSANGTQRFSVLSLPSGVTVGWVISPKTGTMSQGLYSAPSTIAVASSVTVTAKNSVTKAVLGTAIVNLIPTQAPAPPPPPAPTSVSPATATIGPSGTQQFSVLNLPAGTSVYWLTNLSVGSITQGGLYSAPATITSQTTLTVYAKTSATGGTLGTATLTLTPSSAASTSVSPATVTVAPSGTQQFSVVNLPSGANVAWSLSPATGSITSAGAYTAPSTVATQTTVTVTAKNSSTQAVLGTASLTLTATPAPTSLSPATATVAPLGTTQFSVVNLPSGTTVSWGISPSTGTITQAGLYTAPTSVSTQTTVNVTAKNASTNATLGTAVVTLTASLPATPPPSISPATATVAPSGTQQFSVQNLPSGTTVSWAISPSTGSITQAGLYTAPATVATQTTVNVSAMNASTNAVLGTAVVTLTASATTSTITLPVEVVGAAGTTSTASFTIPAGANLGGQLQLWMQIHNLKYETEASVQVNNSAWLAISTSTVTLLGNAAAFGGIGGGFHTLEMTLNLPAGVVTTGTNSITFRFNGTDNVTSGYRVLGFNIQSGGSNLIPSSAFVLDDPNNWQPPSTAASDIAAGQTLWHTAALTAPGMGAIKAHCADCHSEDGRDLKYFNYSNNSIVVRSEFHGLTAAQGNQIASYIRSLNVPNPGRPWNPPYQPGPGLDSQPVANWAAGAGLGAVLDNDGEMQQYIAPGGSTAGWSATSYLNPREIPVAFQLPDWNTWLPIIHPMDAFGTSFTTSAFNLNYSILRNTLQPNSVTAYQAALGGPFDVWFVAAQSFLVPIETNANWDANNLRTAVYSAALWQQVKMWEINQEFGLEGMPQVAFGSKANVRGWYGMTAFNTSPNMLHIPAGTGLGNGSQTVQTYLAFVWYQTQLLLNDGQGKEAGNGPIDFGYVFGFIKNLFVLDAHLPGIMLQLEWQVKSLQAFTLTGVGPDGNPGDAGWAPTATSMEPLLDNDWQPLWSATSPATQTMFLQAYTQAWFAQASQYTPQQYYAGHWATATDNPAALQFQTTFGGQVWYSPPRLRFFGVDANLTNQIAAWGATIWPQGNWASLDSATCTAVIYCTSGY
jgi:hypothetical protein